MAPLTLPVDLGCQPATVGRFRARVPNCLPHPRTDANRIGRARSADDCPRVSTRVHSSPPESANPATM